MSSEPSASRITERQSLGKGRWLELEAIRWRQDDGQLHNWEAVRRQGDGRCVLMVALLKPSDTLILVRQFRPAVGMTSLEFPAGLVDEGESYEDAALREIYEETGYHGSLVQMLPPAAVSSGLTSESIAMAVVHVDENSPENQNPQPQLEASESIETVLLPKPQWPELLKDRPNERVDAKLRAFAMARCLEL